MTTPPIQTIPVGSAISSIASAIKPRTVLLPLRADEDLLAVLTGYLSTSGYVVDCTSAELALSPFQLAHGTIDLLIAGAIEPVSQEVPRCES